jgi:release factor glutamine methyltransferase
MATAETQPWTIQRLLTWTTTFFTDKGRDSARLAAEVLLAEALGIPRIHLYTRFAEVPTEPHLAKFRDWVKRHAAGEPVAYLVGYREFYSLRFEVNSAVLIPRPETEHLVVLALDFLKTLPPEQQRVAEIGTGSGCLAVTIAKQAPECQIWASDVSPAALEVARRNSERHQVSERISFLESDLWSGFPSDQQFALIVSNPPYIGEQESGTLEENVRKYEPAAALFGGPAGHELSERLIDDAIPRLQTGGLLLLETSPFIAARLAEYCRQRPELYDVQIQKDLAKRDRVLLARRR